jgi:REP element-mobilizing transposase RayT
MAVKFKHGDSYAMYFCTFTCYNWLPLFEITNAYNLIYKWFNELKKNNYEIIAYVVMPNHFHAILCFPQIGYDLNKIIGNGKRLIAYEMIERLKEQKKDDLLQLLADAVTEREKSKGQLHRVFEESFDAKPIYNQKFFIQKFNYIHHNPVMGKWHLVNDYTDYEHSSASFYELGIAKSYHPFDFRIL